MSERCMGIEDITNPLNQAEGTIKAARGVLNESVGLVKDVRKVAKEYQQYRENQEDEKAIAPAMMKSRASKRVGKRVVKEAVEDYNAEYDSSMSAAKKAIIAEKRRVEEANMVASLSYEERQAYYAEKAAQTERIKAEKLRLIREADARAERNDIIAMIVLGVLLFLGTIWAFLFWFAWMQGSGLNWLPGVKWIR